MKYEGIAGEVVRSAPIRAFKVKLKSEPTRRTDRVIGKFHFEIAGKAAFTVVDVIAGVSVITREALLPAFKKKISSDNINLAKLRVSRSISGR